MQRFRIRIKSIVLFGAMLGGLGIAALGFHGSAGTAQNLPRDCEATSIIYCGSLTLDELKKDYNSNDGGRYSDIPAVFNHFGISSSDVNGMNSSNHKRGIVKADNTVWLDGKLIGVNAVTAGRVNKSGSTAIPGTGAFKRAPSVSFARPSTQIDAFIGLENGQPAWGILSSCGNPVTWEQPPQPPAPPEKPKLEIQKNIRSADDKSWVESDTFANNSVLTYQLQIRNTSQTADTDVLVKDFLPESHDFVENSVRVDGQTMQNSDNLVKDGIRLSSVGAGGGVTISFQAQVSVAADKCGDTEFMNRARVDSKVAPSKEDTAGGKVRVLCASFECESLTASRLSVMRGESVTFTALASASNTTVSSYEFRVNDVVVQETSSESFTYSADSPGTVKVKVTVKTSQGESTSADCEVRLTVTEKPEVKGVSTLPKTGARGLFGLFVATSASSALVHNLFLRRRGEH